VEGSSKEQRVVDVAVYGIVNAGKSSLINALAGRDAAATGPVGGTTLDVSAYAWREVKADVGPYSVRLIDTPGLQEVGDRTREALATDAAQRSELIVFVTAEDLTASALDAIRALHECGKPILVALNKIDLLEAGELDSVRASVQSRLAEWVAPEHVIPVAAAPIERRFLFGPDGLGKLEVVHGAPQIEALESALSAAISTSAPELKALNEARADVEAHLRDREIDRTQRRESAERVADETSVGLALALAVNPIPLLDFLSSSGGLAILIKRVADVYDTAPSASAANHLAAELLWGGRKSLWGSIAVVGVGGMLKLVPGLGHLTGALAQAAAGGYVCHVLGRALVDYYENGRDWGEGGLVATLDRIAAATDRLALTRGLASRLRARLEKRPCPPPPKPGSAQP
jgi:hypothetical protein